jgi:hypothetical protein
MVNPSRAIRVKGTKICSVWNMDQNILKLASSLGLIVFSGITAAVPVLAQTTAPINPLVTPPTNLPAKPLVNPIPVISGIPLNAACGTSTAARAKKNNLRTSPQPTDQTLYAALISQQGLDLAACRSRSATKIYGLRLQLPPKSNPDTIAALVDQAVDQGYNQLFIEVVNNEGLVLLPSQDLPRPWLPQQGTIKLSPSSPDASNTPDPTSQPAPELDLWQTVVTAAQKRGVQVHGVISLTVDPYDPFAPSLQDLLPALTKRQPTSLIFDLQTTKPLSQMGNGSRLQILNKLPDPNLQGLFQKFLAQGNLSAADIVAAENQVAPRPLRRRSQNPTLTAELTQTAFTNLVKKHQAIGQANLLQTLLYRTNQSDRPKAWGLWQSSQGLTGVLTQLPSENLTAPLWVYPTLETVCDWSAIPSASLTTNLTTVPTKNSPQPDLERPKCQQKLRQELQQLLKVTAQGNSFAANAGVGVHLVKNSLQPAAVCPVIRVTGDSSLDFLEQLSAPVTSQSSQKNFPPCVVVHQLAPSPTMLVVPNGKP